MRSNPKKFKLFSGSASSTTEGLHHHGVVVADLASAQMYGPRRSSS
ncbi:hypothetical protein HMPREF9564_01083 [Cutibacterium acnes HL053PA1]|nr:hypothetical protein HMPREF9593_00583 [Cutibacterium acnes HL046PA2]EFS69149.1 hypothetical protein HMPREF9616_01103 [Cutibacterium acnes HL007PA1]EFT01097.1 hypothetical protein HMPREF9609_00250 [Cutibacterium acnes HL027PA1]EFT18424.1 hypothetical protein HMPREF9564_01083 [Cutibacterium acnes HL053PA1]EFT24732.1 hypothetical protein HMPREF9573_00013 [Cutibacterium acnes HL072PA2]EFT54190.1 hypothetical protein HMPREF9569_00273 [Cutibacterium acnes HL078PA1]EFT62023.1 hypothetical protein